MKVNIYSIVSPLHNSDFMEGKTNSLLSYLKEETGFEYEQVGIEDLYKGDLSLIMVESGGSEGYFLKVFDKLKEPIVLLTFGNSNSLAASMEILTFVQNQGKKGEILHGSDEYIASRIKELAKEARK